jgi:hypothetical protein
VNEESWQIAFARFSEFGARPSVAACLAMFDPEGSVLHPGMPGPLSGPDIEAFITASLAAVPDFRLTPIRWAGHADTVFVEARNTGTVAGRMTGMAVGVPPDHPRRSDTPRPSVLRPRSSDGRQRPRRDDLHLELSRRANVGGRRPRR